MVEVDFEELGYGEALYKVLERRLQSKIDYGDEWVEDEMEDLNFLVQMKARRVKHSKNKKVLIDSLVDLANYTLFVLERELRNTGKFKEEVNNELP